MATKNATPRGANRPLEPKFRPIELGVDYFPQLAIAGTEDSAGVEHEAAAKRLHDLSASLFDAAEDCAALLYRECATGNEVAAALGASLAIKTLLGLSRLCAAAARDHHDAWLQPLAKKLAPRIRQLAKGRQA